MLAMSLLGPRPPCLHFSRGAFKVSGLHPRRSSRRALNCSAFFCLVCYPLIATTSLLFFPELRETEFNLVLGAGAGIVALPALFLRGHFFVKFGALSLYFCPFNLSAAAALYYCLGAMLYATRVDRRWARGEFFS